MPHLEHFLMGALGAVASAFVTSRFELGADAAREFRRRLTLTQVPCTNVALTREL